MNHDEIIALMKKFGVDPIKDRGQNFLVDFGVVEAALKAAGIVPGETVIEIGPGLGVLTGELLRARAKVVAVELDKRLAAVIKQRFMAEINSEQLEVVPNDILQTEISAQKYKIVANIPYNITSKILEKFLLAGAHRPSKLVLLMQKEVAERICVVNSKMNRLAAVINTYAIPKIILTVPKSSFVPQPQVDSALVGILVRSDSDIAARLGSHSQLEFEKFIAQLFSTPRKKIGNVIKLNWDHLGIDPNKRAEALNLDEIYRAFLF